MISKHKMDQASEVAEFIGVPLILVVEVVDGIYYASFHKALSDEPTYGVRQGGRSDRGDAKDFEDCYYLPCDAFVRIAPALPMFEEREP